METKTNTELFIEQKLTTRQLHIANSTKKTENCDIDSAPYLKELGLEIETNSQPIQFNANNFEKIHNWSPYVQGFSASFVQSVIEQYKKEYENPKILDPFTGSGTVLVQAQLNKLEAFGTELNPLLHFIATTKLNSWRVSPNELLETFNNISRKHFQDAPSFLKGTNQFNAGVLEQLQILLGGINAVENVEIKNLFKVAFSAILIDCSNLKRSPCLGYAPNKKVLADAPFRLFEKKIIQISKDLASIQSDFSSLAFPAPSKVILANAMSYVHQNKYDLAITSPPYMNGLDYVINYKIEMGWLGFAQSQKELKSIKDEMVVCDNVSKGMIKNFVPQYSNDWIEEIKLKLQQNIEKRGSYRRLDMPFIVAKYFDDMHKIMRQVKNAMNEKGRFIQVVGDSLIADVYIPTDLLLIKIGQDLGFEVEKIEKARDRRSGQVRSYKLRETIITLKNGK